VDQRSALVQFGYFERRICISACLLGFKADPQPDPKAGDMWAWRSGGADIISSYFIQKCSPASLPPKNLQELSESLVASPNPQGA